MRRWLISRNFYSVYDEDVDDVFDLYIFVFQKQIIAIYQLLKTSE